MIVFFFIIVKKVGSTVLSKVLHPLTCRLFFFKFRYLFLFCFQTMIWLKWVGNKVSFSFIVTLEILLLNVMVWVDVIN